MNSCINCEFARHTPNTEKENIVGCYHWTVKRESLSGSKDEPQKQIYEGWAYNRKPFKDGHTPIETGRMFNYFILVHGDDHCPHFK